MWLVFASAAVLAFLCRAWRNGRRWFVQSQNDKDRGDNTGEC